MRRLHFGVLALTIFLLGILFSFSLVRNSLFPVARVNGDFILLRTVKENVDISKRLYSYGLVQDDAYKKIFDEGEEEIFRSVFESLIVTAIIDANATSDVKERAEKRIEEAIGPSEIANLKPLIDDFHDGDFDAFRKKILEPQALRDVLIEEKGDGYEDWLQEKLLSANVNIWFVPFEWRNNKLCRNDIFSLCN